MENIYPFLVVGLSIVSAVSGPLFHYLTISKQTKLEEKKLKFETRKFISEDNRDLRLKHLQSFIVDSHRFQANDTKLQSFVESYGILYAISSETTRTTLDSLFKEKFSSESVHLSQLCFLCSKISDDMDCDIDELINSLRKVGLLEKLLHKSQKQ